LIEGLPNIVMEALALGRPCLVSDIPAHRDIIQNSVNGFFFDPFDAVSLTQILERVVENPSMLQNMYAACIETGSQFTVFRKIQGYLDIYRDIANIRTDVGSRPSD